MLVASIFTAYCLTEDVLSPPTTLEHIHNFACYNSMHYHYNGVHQDETSKNPSSPIMMENEDTHAACYHYSIITINEFIIPGYK